MVYDAAQEKCWGVLEIRGGKTKKRKNGLQINYLNMRNIVRLHEILNWAKQKDIR